MPRISQCIVALCWCLIYTPLACHSQERFVWPGEAKAAVSLSYDDALDTHLDHAIPALDRYGFKATFYLTLGSAQVLHRMGDWRYAALRGHELGNHTLFHQCSAKGADRTWVEPQNDLDRMDVSQLLAQIRAGNTLLHAMDGKTQRTFTVPCGDLKVQGSDYVNALHADFVAVKSSVGPVPINMASLDRYDVKVFAPVDVTGKQLIDWVKKAATSGTMANITFHGIGGDYLSVNTQAHQELLNYLNAERATYWVDTFLAIMLHVEKQQALLLNPPALKTPVPSLNGSHLPQSPGHVAH